MITIIFSLTCIAGAIVFTNLDELGLTPKK